MLLLTVKPSLMVMIIYLEAHNKKEWYNQGGDKRGWRGVAPINPIKVTC
jgi:hypothetical protein